MPTYTCQRLPPRHRRLLQQFYQDNNSRMRPSAEAALWVAREGPIIGALCLTALPEGNWLTSLFVAPAQRQRGVAAGLVNAALAGTAGPTWLFCAPGLAAFYAGLGFVPATALPAALASRLSRYQRSKTLIALQRASSAPVSTQPELAKLPISAG